MLVLATALLFAVASAVALPMAPPQTSPVCGPVQVAMGVCGYSNGELVFYGEVSAPGDSSGDGGAAPGEVDSEAEQAWRAYLQMLHDRCVAMGENVDECPPPPPPPGEPLEAESFDPITLSDLAAFRPLVGQLVVEPDGWGVVGTPTNFYATAETHTMSGELFDVPIEVRWTPTSYVFDYGDGTSERSDASGTAWRGPEESWTETGTSHTYASRDDVTASLTVVFTAEVDAGGGWFPVPGTLPVAAPSVPVKIFEVGTVLTDGDCMANPMAAGCG